MARAYWLSLAMMAAFGASASAQSLDTRPFKAAGVDPAFALRISDNDIILHTAAERLSFADAALLYPRWNGTIYEAQAHGRRLIVRVRNDRRCAEGARGEAQVEVTLDDRELRGCGGYVEPGR